MKMILIVIDEAKKEELEVFLNRSGVVGYTELDRARGSGATGPRLGSAAFPRTSAVFFTFLEDDALDRLRSGVEEFCDACGERLKMFAWGAERIF